MRTKQKSRTKTACLLLALACLSPAAAIQSGDYNYLGRSTWFKDKNPDFEGQMDEVRVWKTARSQAQIRETMFRSLTGTEEDLVGLWNFDEDDARDASTDRFHGALQGAARCVVEQRPSASNLVNVTLLQGKVSDETGQPLTNASVRLDQDGLAVAQVATTAGGQYQVITYPTAKPYDPVATSGPKGVWRTGLRLRAGESRREDLTLQDPAGISGTLRMFDQTPHVGVPVQVLDATNLVVATTLSDDGGNYRFGNLKPGQYLLRCQVLGGFQYYVAPNESEFDPAGDNFKSQISKLKLASVTVQPGRALEKIDFRFPHFKKGTWRNYTTSDGLAGPIVYAIEGKKAGPLWVGGFGQISRFDGKHMVSFEGQNPLPGGILAICHADDGTVWFGSKWWRPFLARFDGQRFVTFEGVNELANRQISSLQTDTDGTLWIGTDQGLCFYDGARFFTPAATNVFAGLSISVLHRAADDTMWVGTASGAYRVRKSAKPRPALDRIDDSFSGREVDHFTKEQGLLEDKITSIASGPQGVVWFGSSGGVSRFDGTQFTGISVRDGLRSSSVQSLAAEPDGTLWIGFFEEARRGRGIARYDGRTIVNYGTADGLANEAVTALYCAPDGVLWVGTDGGGLFSYDAKSFVRFTVKDGLPNDYVGTVQRDSGGDMWVSGGWKFASEGGLFRRDFAAAKAGIHRLVNYGAQIGLPNHWWATTARDAKGCLWVQSPQSGVYRYDGTNLLHLPYTSWALGRGIDETIWSVNEEGLGRIEGTNLLILAKTADGPSGRSIGVLLQTGDGQIWTSTDSGLARYDGRSLDRL